MTARLTHLLVLGTALACLCGQAGPALTQGTKVDDPEVTKLLHLQRVVLKQALEHRVANYKNGFGRPESILKLSRELMENTLELATTKAERIDACNSYFKLVCEFDEREVARVEVGTTTMDDFLTIRSERLRAEIALRRAGGKPPAGTKPPREPRVPKDKE